MFEWIYDWTLRITYYLIMVTAVMHILPKKDYSKYIRFFTGMVLIVMLTMPILQLFGEGELLQNPYDSQAYEEYMEQLQNSSEYLEDIERYEEEALLEDEEGDAKTESTVSIEEIRIGR